MRSVGTIEKIYQQYKEIAEFRLVYITEAHAADGDWPMRSAIEKGIKQQKTFKERCTTALMLQKEKKLTMPMLVDGMDNKVNSAYKALPDRIFLVRKDGRLGVAGAKGPRGFSPGLKDVEAWLKEFKASGKEPELKDDSPKKEKPASGRLRAWQKRDGGN